MLLVSEYCREIKQISLFNDPSVGLERSNIARYSVEDHLIG